MIDKALNVLKNEVKAFIMSKADERTGEEKVHLTAITDDQGKLAIPLDSVGLSLINIEEDRITKAQLPHIIKNQERPAYTNPSINLNLYIIFAANFKNYPESLKFISYIISCFQAKMVFTPIDTPDLAPCIEKLIVELNTQTPEQQHFIWGIIGSGYLPSVVYKVRMITVQEGRIIKEGTGIETIKSEGHK